ncbi:MAG: hypothetical protein WC389_22760 [Lutibacter sp.]|jgi:hypothetical protein
MIKQETSNTHEPANGGYGVLTAGNFKPILFSTPMVQAILRGEKTQTRRIVKYSKKITDPKIGFSAFTDKDQFEVRGVHENGQYGSSLFKMKYKVGDILWVRETWQHTRVLNLHPTDENYGYVYKADGQPWDDYEEWTWKPSIFMPKDACRIFLKITKIRIERLEDITKEDAIAEGIEKWEQMCQTRYKSYVEPMVGFWDDGNHLQTGGVHAAIASYRSLWAKINGFDNLNSNPWVFVYEFERTDASFACR